MKSKPILVITNKRSYTVLPVNAGETRPVIPWLKGEKVVEISVIETETEE
jgi:hypothetical protein